MGKQRRSFSVEQKLQIIQEADQNGVTQTLRKHNVSHSVYLRWKNEASLNYSITVSRSGYRVKNGMGEYYYDYSCPSRMILFVISS